MTSFIRATPPIQKKETGWDSPLSRGFLTLMNGEISVISEEGKGSTFTVRLPIAVKTEKREQIGGDEYGGE